MICENASTLASRFYLYDLPNGEILKQSLKPHEVTLMSETMHGYGKIFKGQDFINDVQYDLRIQSKVRKIETLTSSDVIRDFSDVRLRITPATAITRHLGERLTLHMSDGRKQDFFVRTSEGECKATGGPY
jgi:hypothetical protein